MEASRTARALKWNTVDRIASQVLYGVVGVVLANIVPPEDFGLIGALLAFQAFAIIFADSGLGAALLRLKDPGDEDYSTVFWFNLIVCIAIYWLLWACAPLIARIFQNDLRLIPLSKVMFLTFVLNALAIVQTNRLMKMMDVRMLAVSNIIAQVAGGALGIVLALRGAGAWALVWQSVSIAGLRTAVLWITGGWLPTSWMKLSAFRRVWRIGLSVFSSSMLNTAFLQVYSFVTGAFYSLRDLGYYTQADKWSKMGTASLSQVLTATFVPLLSAVQDQAAEFLRLARKISRFCALITIPAMTLLATAGESLFHTLFAGKWDSAIPLFQLLCVRGIFVVFTSLHGNFLLAKGYGKRLFSIEIIKDASIAAAILATVWFRSLETLVWGQCAASLLTWAIVSLMIARSLGYPVKDMAADILPFAGASAALAAASLGASLLPLPPAALLAAQTIAGTTAYLAVMRLFRFPELPEALSLLTSRRSR